MNNEDAFKIGDVIVGEFKIQDIFGGEGKSGMGVVYLVTHRDYERPFVLKTFQKDKNNSIQRFRQEAEIWVSSGIHQNIVQALFVEEINDRLFVGAEYIDPDELGRNTVTDYLKQGGTSNQNIIRWASQFCYGMEYAISNGFKVHRDIKPDNLMIDVNGNLKITDFGISKFDNRFENINDANDDIGFNKIINQFLNNKTELSNPSNLTEEGSFLGTILYASPEQLIDSSKIDFRSDIYSFGIILYQLISLGGYPYSLVGKTTIEDLALMHLQEDIIKIDHPLIHIAYKCLARNPNQRYQNFIEFLNDLRRIAKRLQIQLPRNYNNHDYKLRELYIKSYSYRALGDIKNANNCINKYLIEEKEDSSAWSLKGRIEHELGNLEKALDYTLVSYEIDPNNSHTCNNLGIFYKDNNHLEKAERFLKEAIEIDPYNSGALTNLAIVYEEMKYYDMASEMIVRALKLAPDKKTLHINASNMAAEATKNKYFEFAIEILEILTKVDSGNTNNWFNLAVNYQLTFDSYKAIKCFKIVEQHLPNDEQTLISLAKLSGEIGNYEEGISYCEKLLDNKLSILNAICWRAQFMQAKGNGKEAIEFMKSVISNNKMNDHLWITLARLYANEGNYKYALSMINKAHKVLIENGEGGNKDKIQFLINMKNQYEYNIKNK